MALNIGNRREPFWDDHLVDTAMTTASAQVMQPVFKETLMWLDKPEDGQTISYPNIVKVDDTYRMYYIAWGDTDWGVGKVRLCVIESRDGINWTRPSLGQYEENGSTDNNIVLTGSLLEDNAFVFNDPNPACPPEQKFKILTSTHVEVGGKKKRGLWCLVSPDGYHFELSHLVTVYGAFDTNNTVHWDGKRYVAYVRNYHNIVSNQLSGHVDYDGISDISDFDVPWPDLNKGIRDVRVIYSEDFVHWTTPVRLEYSDGQDFPMYTNQVIPYERAPHILIGFPTRYCERKEWTPCFDQLPGAAIRQEIIQSAKAENREAFTVTSCLFMSSRDTLHWYRWREAFMAPGYEEEYNWVYGDGYPAYNLIDTGEGVYSMYSIDWHRAYGKPKPLNRWEIRKDGFACYSAGADEKVLVTKPLVFEGSRLHLNFSGSAFGYIYVDLLDEDGNPISGESFEVFGDTIDREVFFADGSDFAPFAGKPVRIRFRMSDVKLYSMKFE